MISFRYHLVTVVAIFLALSLGVVMGTTVIDQGLVERLEQQTRDANAAATRARERAGAMDDRLRREETFAADAADTLIRGRLSGESVVVFSDDGTDGPAVQRAAAALEGAGAQVQAILATTPRLELGADDDRRELAAILGLAPDTDPAQMRAALARAIGDRLATGSRPAEDVLFELVEAGFIAGGAGPGLSASPEGTFPDLGGPDQILVVVSGGGPEPPVEPEDVLLPVATTAVARGASVAGVEPAVTPHAFVVPLRREVQGPVVTVDAMDEASGSYALAVGLSDLIGFGEGAAYGFKSGADAPYPPLEP